MKATAILLALATTAAAQPGMVAPSYQRLTPDEEAMLDKGEITSQQRGSGTLLAFIGGFGLGQAVQGRWSSRGWKFAIAEVLAVGVFATGVIRDRRCSCDCDCGGDVGPGLAGLGGLAWATIRIWETLDAAVAPSNYNAHLHELELRAGYTFYVAPHASGAVAGLGYTF